MYKVEGSWARLAIEMTKICCLWWVEPCTAHYTNAGLANSFGEQEAGGEKPRVLAMSLATVLEAEHILTEPVHEAVGGMD